MLPDRIAAEDFYNCGQKRTIIYSSILCGVPALISFTIINHNLVSVIQNSYFFGKRDLDQNRERQVYRSMRES